MAAMNKIQFADEMSKRFSQSLQEAEVAAEAERELKKQIEQRPVPVTLEAPPVQTKKVEKPAQPKKGGKPVQSN